MFHLARRLIVPSVIMMIVGGLWSLAILKAELESPLPDSMRVDPALVQKALRASYASQSVVDFDPEIYDPVGTWGRWNKPDRS
jgi:hypothetical protein